MIKSTTERIMHHFHHDNHFMCWIHHEETNYNLTNLTITIPIAGSTSRDNHQSGRDRHHLQGTKGQGARTESMGLLHGPCHWSLVGHPGRRSWLWLDMVMPRMTRLVMVGHDIAGSGWFGSCLRMREVKSGHV